MTGNDEAAQLADAILRFRRHRTRIFSRDIVGEPAWETMLEIFVADARGLPMTGRLVAERHHVPGAVMSRWLKHLTADGLLVGDGTGNLDDELTLSGAGMEKMEEVLIEARSLKDTFVPRTRAVG
ncbi:hypothetical protein [Sphingomonas sp. Leaf20]|uniref:hypothetical protein n=1 Tax=Sphingomonas sp. Leaf20 TaxID=1735685 RepID=UPI0006F9FEDC|nr:hypothetical protein [Sphingomonas sp. Leaf20]KQM72710.1 hypothetical protein ASE72_19335 [Sphingomonas sp. Leaf20]